MKSRSIYRLLLNLWKFTEWLRARVDSGFFNASEFFWNHAYDFYVDEKGMPNDENRN